MMQHGLHCSSMVFTTLGLCSCFPSGRVGREWQDIKNAMNYELFEAQVKYTILFRERTTNLKKARIETLKIKISNQPKLSIDSSQ